MHLPEADHFCRDRNLFCASRRCIDTATAVWPTRSKEYGKGSKLPRNQGKLPVTARRGTPVRGQWCPMRCTLDTEQFGKHFHSGQSKDDGAQRHGGPGKITAKCARAPRNVTAEKCPSFLFFLANIRFAVSRLLNRGCTRRFLRLLRVGPRKRRTAFWADRCSRLVNEGRIYVHNHRKHQD